MMDVTKSRADLKKEVIQLTRNICNIEVNDEMVDAYVQHFSKIEKSVTKKSSFNKIVKLGRTATFSYEIKKRFENPENSATRKIRALLYFAEAYNNQNKFIGIKKNSNLMRFITIVNIILLVPLYLMLGSLLRLVYGDL